MFYFWKIENRWEDLFFKGSLGDVTNQGSASAQKRFCEKMSRSSFFNFYFLNFLNWDLKFAFQFDNENEKRKKNQNSTSF